MDAEPILVEIGRLLRDVNLEAVLIGNAAAALQGTPVTTIALDFFLRKTVRNLISATPSPSPRRPLPLTTLGLTSDAPDALLLENGVTDAQGFSPAEGRDHSKGFSIVAGEA